MKYSSIALCFSITMIMAMPLQAGGGCYRNKVLSNTGVHTQYKRCDHNARYTVGAATKARREHYRSNYTQHEKTIYRNTDAENGLTLESFLAMNYIRRVLNTTDEERSANNAPVTTGHAYVLDKSGYCYLIRYKNGVQIRSQADFGDCH